MSAKEIIAGCILGGSTFDHKDRLDMAEEALSALTSAGYRILAPGSLDGPTLEAAAKVIEDGREVPDPLDNYQSTVMADWTDMDELAAAIRALGGGDG